MDNYQLAGQLSLLSQLMDIHGENAFRAKTYSIAAFTIEKLQQPLAGMSEAQISRIKNIGESAAKKIIELLETGELQALNQLLAQTPPGVLEMLSVKGLGPKKIHTLWKELKIDSMESLQQACVEHRLSAVKGFGQKTEEKILQSLAFKQEAKGKYLYSQIESFAEAFTEKLQNKFPQHQTAITGAFRRQLEIINKLQWVTTVPKEELLNYLTRNSATITEEDDDRVTLTIDDNLTLQFYLSDKNNFTKQLFLTTGTEDFLSSIELKKDAKNEEEIFLKQELHYIPPALRETKNILSLASKKSFDDLIQLNDIKGLIHCHSDWSDGSHTIEEMALALIDLGFEYMVISDHSKSAYYAGGLTEERIIAQQQYVDALNEKLRPFKIFKSIECDILGDGGLDYSNDLLAGFDLVITSIHSNLDMKQDKAMERLMGAISNPYTTILGHMTGRLLLKRNGYPVDHKAIIDACAQKGIVIEINANPKRLDMDWRWLPYALEKNLLLSINPDAHSIEEIQLLKYGVLAAQKGGLTAKNNLSSFSLQQFEAFLAQRKERLSAAKAVEQKS